MNRNTAPGTGIDGHRCAARQGLSPFHFCFDCRILSARIDSVQYIFRKRLILKQNKYTRRHFLRCIAPAFLGRPCRLGTGSRPGARNPCQGFLARGCAQRAERCLGRGRILCDLAPREPITGVIEGLEGARGPRPGQLRSSLPTDRQSKNVLDGSGTQLSERRRDLLCALRRQHGLR